MTIVLFLVHLITSDPNLCGIHNDDVVASIYVRGLFGRVSAAKPWSDLGRESTEHFIGRIDQIPVLDNGFRFCCECTHR